jgi:hypothetical protein
LKRNAVGRGRGKIQGFMCLLWVVEAASNDNSSFPVSQQFISIRKNTFLWSEGHKRLCDIG